MPGSKQAFFCREEAKTVSNNDNKQLPASPPPRLNFSWLNFSCREEGKTVSNNDNKQLPASPPPRLYKDGKQIMTINNFPPYRLPGYNFPSPRLKLPASTAILPQKKEIPNSYRNLGCLIKYFLNYIAANWTFC